LFRRRLLGSTVAWSGDHGTTVRCRFGEGMEITGRKFKAFPP
jgi:hypothetical protein